MERRNPLAGPRRRSASRALTLLARALLAACGDERGEELGGLVCTAEFVPGLVIEVEDRGGTAICDAVVTASDGTQEGVLPAGPDCRYRGAWERPGTYDVTAKRAGLTASADGLLVLAGACHVVRVERTLVLVP